MLTKIKTHLILSFLLFSLNSHAISNKFNLIDTISNSFIATDTVDLELNAISIVSKININSEGEIKFTVFNKSLEKSATNIQIVVKTPYQMSYSIFKQSTSSKGEFDINSNIWTISSIPQNDSATLNLKYKILNDGIWYLEGEVFKLDQFDLDSTPNNDNQNEDDFAKSCFSIPIVSSETPFLGKQIIIEDSTLSNITWSRNNSIIPNQTAYSLSVTSIGEYNFQSPQFKCPIQGCCPFIFVGGTNPFCCQPLEYLLSKNNYSSAPAVLVEKTTILQPDATKGKDATIFSQTPNLNLGTDTDFIVMSWTWFSQGLGEGDRRSLIDFDLSSIPNNATIVNATLDFSFNKTSTAYPSIASRYATSKPNESYLRRITSQWDELTVTWANQPTYTLENQVVIPNNSGIETDVTVDVTNLIKDQKNNPNESFGLAFSLVTEEIYRAMLFASSDHLDPNKRPKLTVKYLVSE